MGESNEVTLQRAQQAFANKNYSAAIKAFKMLNEVYETNAFNINIRICNDCLEEETHLRQVFHPHPTYQDLSYINKFFDEVYLVNLKEDIHSRMSSEYRLIHHNIEYTIVEAINGYKGKPFEDYKCYKERPLGKLKKFPEYSKREIEKGKSFIESAGAIGYIYTYRKIIEDALLKGHESILILEDDVAFVNNASLRIKDFLGKVSNNWKILHLGCSQYSWKNISEREAQKIGFYYPRIIETCGSFAIGINQSVFLTIIDLISGDPESPFDLLPLGRIYENSLGQCFSAFPAIAIPDVSQSNIRAPRDQISHSKRMKWPLNEIEYPFHRPLVQILLKSSEQIKFASSIKRFYERGYILNLYRYSEDGLRPIHENCYLPFDGSSNNEESTRQLVKKISESRYWLVKYNDSPLTEEQIHMHLLDNAKNGYAKVEVGIDTFLQYTSGLTSIVIQTSGRPKGLKTAIESCLQQTYSDIEIIVVSNNEDQSNIDSVKEIERTLKSQANIKFIYHTQSHNSSAARNTGAIESSGEYICFLNDHDIYYPERIEQAVDLLASLPSYYGGVYCGYQNLNNSESNEASFSEEDLFKKVIMLDYKNHNLHINTVTVRRSVFFSVNGFNEAYTQYQDVEYHLRILSSYRLKPLSKIHVKLNDDSFSKASIDSDATTKKAQNELLKDFSKEIMAYGDNFLADILKAHRKILRDI